MKKQRQVSFVATGKFTAADTSCKPLRDNGGNIFGFRLPDGSTVDLAICLRHEKDGVERCVFSDKDLRELGLDGLTYTKIEFSIP